MTTAEFENVLIDVRKAYRLLYLYQRRIMDLVQFIGDTFSFRYAGGYPLYSENTPREGKGDLDRWAWDWMTMYFYEFKFSSRESNEATIHFSICIQSDTGYYDAGCENPLEVDLFSDVSTASTRLIFFVGKNTSYDDHDDAIVDSNPLYKKDSKDCIFKDGDRVFLAKSYPLSEFISSESTLESLGNWIRFCKENGISEISINKQ